MEKNKNNEFTNPVNNNEKEESSKKMTGKKILIGVCVTIVAGLGIRTAYKKGYKNGFCTGAWAQAVADRTAPGKETEVQSETGIPVARMKELGNSAQTRLTERGYGRWFGK